jgi:hypothetical protein
MGTGVVVGTVVVGSVVGTGVAEMTDVVGSVVGTEGIGFVAGIGVIGRS